MGELAWRVITACTGQVRMGFGGAYAWDFPAVLTMAALLGADVELVADVLPEIEPCVLRAWQKE